MTDENYGALTRFFRQAREHLRPEGRMLVSFGTSGDIGYLRQLIVEEAFNEQVVARVELVRDDKSVEYFTFLLS